MMGAPRAMSAGTRVRVVEAGPVPSTSTWDDDHNRTSTSLKRRLQQMFFNGDKKIQAEIVFIGSESERDSLRRKNLVKVAVRDPAGSAIVITAESKNLIQK
ncbi:MAG: hypothetical protein JNG88_07330 [Phycisphaerales bacterium]|nr:hypothetical protein [Phycisphaerales bacterium]